MKPIKLSSLLVFALLLGGAVVLSACTFSLAEEITPPPGSQQMPASQAMPTAVASGPLYPLVAPNPQDGQNTYTEKCAPCHGSTGQGDGPQAASLPNPTSPIGSADVARGSTPAEWYRIVSQGNLDRFMPPFQSLSDRQRWDVIAYAYSLSAPAESIANGEAVFTANCAACHGVSGKGNGPQASTVSAKLPDFTNQAYMAEKSTADFYTAISNGAGSVMHAFSDLSEDDRWDTANYLRSLSFAPTGQAAAVVTTAVETSAAPEATAEPAETETNETTGTEQTEEPAEAAAPAQAAGVIAGEVVNASGGVIPSDLVITLHGFDGMQVVMTDTVTTAEDGTFLFEDVEMVTGRVFLATTEFGQATYASPIVGVEEGQSSLKLDITTYDTTTDVSSMSADRLHVFFDFSEPGVVQVIELYIMSNMGNKTIVPAEKGGPVVTFSLPPGAHDLQFQDGELGKRYVQVPGGFGDTLAVRPSVGEYQVLFAYQMDYDRKLDLNRPLNMPVQAVVIMQPEDGIKIKSDQLQDGGPRQIQGATYRIFSGGPFTAGESIDLSLAGNPGGSASALAAAGSNESLIIGLGAFGIVLIAAGVWLFRRSQSSEDEAGDELDEEDEAPVEEDDAETLMDAIIALDDLYQAGELPEPAYRERRADLKARLKNLEGRA